MTVVPLDNLGWVTATKVLVHALTVGVFLRTQHRFKIALAKSQSQFFECYTKLKIWTQTLASKTCGCG